jgi:hypothetical protein
MTVQTFVSEEVEVFSEHAHFDGAEFLGNQVLHRLEGGLMSLPEVVLDELKSVCPRLVHGSNIMQYFIALVHYFWGFCTTKFELS